MDIYKEMYLILFNRVTDALEAIDCGDAAVAVEILRAAQSICEEKYMAGYNSRQE